MSTTKYYILMEIDNKICSFKYDGIVLNKKIFNKKRMPNKNLNIWINQRIIPYKHKSITLIKNSLYKPFIAEDLFFQNNGLSLTDCYWIYEITEKEYKKGKKAKVNVKWDDINFFKNDFEHGYGYALYNVYDYIHNRINNISLNSPDICMNGYALKYWTIENNKRICYKKFFRNNESIKKEIMLLKEAQKINPKVEVIKYEETEYGYKSECFVNDKERLISAQSLGIDNLVYWQKYLKKKKVKNYKEYVNLLNEMIDKFNLKLDASNIEIIENIETNEYRLAPLHFNV